MQRMFPAERFHQADREAAMPYWLPSPRQGRFMNPGPVAAPVGHPGLMVARDVGYKNNAVAAAAAVAAGNGDAAANALIAVKGRNGRDRDWGFYDEKEWFGRGRSRSRGALRRIPRSSSQFTYHSSSRSRSRSRMRAIYRRATSPSTLDDDLEPPAVPLSQSFKSAFVSALVEMIRVRKLPSGWTGEKGKRVLQAAYMGGLLDQLKNDPEKNGSLSKLAEVVLSTMSVNRLVFGSRKYDDVTGRKDPRGWKDVFAMINTAISAKDMLKARSKSRARGRSLSRAGIRDLGLERGADVWGYEHERSRSRSRSRSVYRMMNDGGAVRGRSRSRFRDTLDDLFSLLPDLLTGRAGGHRDLDSEYDDEYGYDYDDEYEDSDYELERSRSRSRFREMVRPRERVW